MSWPIDVRKADLRIEYYRGSGKGGQNRNKRDTACRITHLPTKLAATAEEHKSQGQNRKAAFRRLSKRLVPLMREAAEGKAPEKRTAVRVRSYHEHDQRVKDSRLPGRSWSYNDVVHGVALEEILGALVDGGS